MSKPNDGSDVERAATLADEVSEKGDGLSCSFCDDPVASPCKSAEEAEVSCLVGDPLEEFYASRLLGSE